MVSDELVWVRFTADVQDANVGSYRVSGKGPVSQRQVRELEDGLSEGVEVELSPGDVARLPGHVVQVLEDAGCVRRLDPGEIKQARAAAKAAGG